MIPLSQIRTLGRGLARPECVLATANGRLYCSSWRGGVTILEADGGQWELLARDADFEVLPNGITLMPDGSFLLSHLGAETGGVFRLHADGRLEAFLLEVDGIELPPTNYAHLDTAGRIWITVSTRQVPRANGYRADVADGFIILVDERGARIVADDLGYTNECIVHPDGKQLYVNETFSRRLTRFALDADGSLSDRQVVAEFGAGSFPDGLVFDAAGGAWITSIVSNRVLHLDAAGKLEIVVEDNEPDHVARAEAAYLEGSMGRPHLDQAKSRLLRNISSMAFGGRDLKTAYLGCLLDDRLYAFDAPVAGHPPAHWHFSGPRRADHAT